jgi:uncharacterized OB-fold protein
MTDEVEDMTTLKLHDDVFAGPPPVIRPESEPFWNALANGEFRAQQCDSCETIRFPITTSCHKCLGFDYTWVPVSGAGTVQTAVAFKRATPWSTKWDRAVPYVSGLVDLPEGIRVPGRILCTCGAGSARGTEVTMCRVPANNGMVLYAFEHAC